jgi:hypothetical protein
MLARSIDRPPSTVRPTLDATSSSDAKTASNSGEVSPAATRRGPPTTGPWLSSPRLSCDSPIRSEVVAKVELEPMGDSGTSGIATFEEAGNPGVEAALEIEGLPKPGATYYAHFHEGRCADVPTEDGDHHRHEDTRTHGRVGVALALVRTERFLPWGSGPDYAHAGHDHGREHAAPAKDSFGNLEVPIPISSSSARGEHDGYAEERSAGAASVWGPQVSPRVHASDSEDTPVLACAPFG